MQKDIECKNCRNLCVGNYCNNCGQSTKVQEINSHYFLQELKTELFQLEKGFFFTIKELLIHPGESIREYFSGKRIKYLKPISFVLLMATIYFFAAYFVDRNTTLNDFLSGILRSVSENNENEKMVGSTLILQWMISNYTYATLLILPAFSFASYLAFKKFGYNYFEHLVLNSYIEGIKIAIQLLFIPIDLVIPTEYNDTAEIIRLAAIFLFTFWAFTQFFNKGQLFNTIFRTLLTYMNFLFMTLIFILLLVFVISKI